MDDSELLAKVKQLQRELHDEWVRRDEWEKMYNQAITGTEAKYLQEKLGQVKTTLDHEVDSRVHAELEVERLQAELALVRADHGHTYCAFCGAEYPQGTPRHGDGALTQHIMVCPEHPMREVEQERDRALAELALTHVKLNRVRQDAQDQSDEVQELWLSPCEAEGLKRQLTKAEALAALVNEETAKLLDRLAEWSERAQDYAVGHWTAQDDQIGADAEVSRALAARIREVLEANDDRPELGGGEEGA